jgi:hypothetical protein
MRNREEIYRVYAADDGTIDPAELGWLVDQDANNGQHLGTISYIEPIGGGDPQPWGLELIFTYDMPLREE